MSSWANAAAGAPTSGPILELRRSAPTPVVDFGSVPRSSPLPCSRMCSSTSAIEGTSSLTHSWARAPLIASEKTGRICRGLELDPQYVDVIIRRFESATGKAAILDQTGEEFSVLASRRAAEAASQII